VVWKTILRQLNTADQLVWADRRASTPILYGPDFLPTPTDQLCSIGADSPPLSLSTLLYGNNGVLCLLSQTGAGVKGVHFMCKYLRIYIVNEDIS